MLICILLNHLLNSISVPCMESWVDFPWPHSISNQEVTFIIESFLSDMLYYRKISHEILSSNVSDNWLPVVWIIWFICCMILKASRPWYEYHLMITNINQDHVVHYSCDMPSDSWYKYWSLVTYLYAKIPYYKHKIK